MIIQRTMNFELTTDEELTLLRKYSKYKRNIFNIIANSPNGNCPFSDYCNEFPCDTLSCSADCCTNGSTYRMS